MKEFSSEQIQNFTKEVLGELRKVHYKELGAYSDKMILIKLITMRSTIGLDPNGYGRSLAKSGDIKGIYIWNYHWMVHKARLEELALVYGRLMQFDVPVLEQFHKEGKRISAEDRNQVLTIIETVRASLEDLKQEELIVDALYLVKRLCMQVKLHAPEWWITERNKIDWIDKEGGFLYDLDLGAF